MYLIKNYMPNAITYSNLIENKLLDYIYWKQMQNNASKQFSLVTQEAENEKSS